jgi:hypothetical protein
MEGKMNAPKITQQQQEKVFAWLEKTHVNAPALNYGSWLNDAEDRYVPGEGVFVVEIPAAMSVTGVTESLHIPADGSEPR